MKMAWEISTFKNKGARICYAAAGKGPPLVFLHGGPGDDHVYLRPFAEPFFSEYRCILPDQRGSGKSEVESYNSETLHLSNFIDDIEALRIELGQDRLKIVGHSWGASLGLFYGLAHPDRVERLALVGLGPINEEMTAVYSANLFSRFTVTEQVELKRLRQKRNEAAKNGDDAAVKAAHIEVVTGFFSRCWIYSEEARKNFVAEFPKSCVYNRKVPLHLMPTIDGFDILPALQKLIVPVLVMYGYQDIEPITQAFLLQKGLKQSRVTFINECGHLPWVDQPQKCFQELKEFLG